MITEQTEVMRKALTYAERHERFVREYCEYHLKLLRTEHEWKKKYKERKKESKSFFMLTAVFAVFMVLLADSLVKDILSGAVTSESLYNVLFFC